MSARVKVTRDELDKAAAVARKLEQRDKLCALAFDLLSRQAEGRSLLSGQGFVAERAESHGIERDSADTPYGNLLSILEQGPDSGAKYALLAALYVAGFARAHAAEQDKDDGEPASLLQRFVEHNDWLEVCSPYRVAPLLPKLLDASLLDSVAGVLGDALLRDDAEANDAATRARNAARIAALEALGCPAAEQALQRVASDARDAYSRVVANALLSTESAAVSELDISGRWGGFPPRLPLALLRWLSGWALLSWIGRGLLWAVGYRRAARVRLAGKALTVERTSQLWGRRVRTESGVHPVDQLRVARRAARFPLLHSLVGVASLGAGVLLGGLFVFDAVRVGELPLLGVGGALLLAGAGLDLVLSVLIPGSKGRVSLDLDLGPGRRARVSGIEQPQADALLSALAKLHSR